MAATGGLEMGAWAEQGRECRTSASGLDHTGKRENRGYMGRPIPWDHLLFRIKIRISLDIVGPHRAASRMLRVEIYAKKPYTLEKIGISVRGELEK